MKYLTKLAFIVAWLFLCAINLQAAETKPHIVLLSGESLYGSASTLPKFAKRLEQQYGYRCTTIVREEEEEHRFPSLDDKTHSLFCGKNLSMHSTNRDTTISSSC